MLPAGLTGGAPEVPHRETGIGLRGAASQGSTFPYGPPFGSEEEDGGYALPGSNKGRAKYCAPRSEKNGFFWFLNGNG